MGNRRIYAGYYRRYDSKLIYVVTVAKDTDTDKEMVIWTPATYSEKHTYYTTSKQSFCESVLVDGARQPKFKRQTQMRVLDSVMESFEAEGFFRLPRKTDSHINDGYDTWCRPRVASYYEYAKKLCKGYRFSLSKYELCIREKRYIGISKEDFKELKSDLAFLKNCLKTVLNDYASYFEERFAKGLSIRKYAQAHGLNRGSVDHLQRKFFTAFAQALKERDEAEGQNRLQEN
ncbi:MAG: DUF1653 domain-containing protein [Oscillospiraceae bacterium]|nr:DUF1653 domain-containing protein [Oscillospiraceae bacterium]